MKKPIDVEGIKKSFRIINGNLERFNHHYKNGKWTIVNNNRFGGKGYCQVGFNRRLIMYHHIIWILSTGKDIPQDMEIDHINGDRIDSRISNMRMVTKRGNLQNRKEHREGKICGCYFNKRQRRYRARITINRNDIFLGYYTTEKEAQKAYTTACGHTEDYVDNKSFREMIKKIVEESK